VRHTDEGIAYRTPYTNEGIEDAQGDEDLARGGGGEEWGICPRGRDREMFWW